MPLSVNHTKGHEIAVQINGESGESGEGRSTKAESAPIGGRLRLADGPAGLRGIVISAATLATTVYGLPQAAGNVGDGRGRAPIGKVTVLEAIVVSDESSRSDSRL